MHRTVVSEISQTEPRPAVDTGELRNSVYTSQVPDGAIVSVDAPHAGVVEYGRRPGGRKPPLQPLIDWVRRHKSIVKAFKAETKSAYRKQIKAAAQVVGRAYAVKAGRATKAHEEMAVRSAAFAIQAAIAKNGIAPRHYFAKAWTRAEPAMVNSLLLEIAKTSWKPTAQGRLAIQTMFNSAKKAAAGGGAA
jgi:hypothetical protein